MELYVCWGTFKPAPRPGGHPCGRAYAALRDAGHEPRVIKAYGLALLPETFNRTSGRREVKRLTGSQTVPALVTDDGQVITDSREIIAWAREHPAGAVAA